MNREFAAKLLQQLNQKRNNKNKGFTLIELLVVVIIIGVLAAVALPNLLGQVGKARETEMKNAVGGINRGQQAYHFERQVFSDDIPKLGLKFDNKYIDTFTITSGGAASATVVALNDASADGKDSTADGTRAYAGGIYYTGGEYDQFLCQSNEAASSTTAPTSAGACAANATIVK